jgi:hypothetical protein
VEGAIGTTADDNGDYLSGSIIRYCEINYGGGISNKNYSIALFIMNNRNYIPKKG